MNCFQNAGDKAERIKKSTNRVEKGEPMACPNNHEERTAGEVEPRSVREFQEENLL